MITGDNLLTAVAIAKKCELFLPSTQIVRPLITENKLQWQYLNTTEIVDVSYTRLLHGSYVNRLLGSYVNIC